MKEKVQYRRHTIQRQQHNVNGGAGQIFEQGRTMAHWVQIDLLDAIAEAEALQKKKEVTEELYPWEHKPVCESWIEAKSNEYGDFTEGYYMFQGGSTKEQSKVVLSAALNRPNIYYAFGARDESSASYQALFRNEEQTDGIYDGVDDIMAHVSRMLQEFCDSFNVQQRHIDKVLNDFKRKLTE